MRVRIGTYLYSPAWAVYVAACALLNIVRTVAGR